MEQRKAPSYREYTRHNLWVKQRYRKNLEYRFKVMEKKLFFGIMTPGAVITIALGLWRLMANWSAYMIGYWMHVKISLVLLLIIYHIWCGKIVKDFKYDRNTKSHVWFRWFNEAPVLALIAIIILVKVKPF